MLQVQKLAGNWKFKAVTESEWQPAKVPGCVHTDLLNNGRIEDPFYGTNEHRLQWIDKQDWEYETVFDVAADIKSSSRFELVMEGLDTYADVYLNGSLVLSADNMFREWRVDAKEGLKQQGNKLRIVFRSPIQEDLPKLERLGYALPATNDQSEVGELGEKKVSIFARKAPYHYGWDWGPRFVTSGIWREIRLEAWSAIRMTDLYIRQDNITEEQAKLAAVIELEADGEYEGALRLAADGQHWEQEVRLSAGVNRIELEANIANPRLWWCRGFGEPNLYTFEASFTAANGTAASRSVRTGLRSVRLVTDKDQYGTSFYVELNGQPVFAKGANHIPNDSFITEVTRERYRYEIESAVRANMNMLRVWGGGVYEQSDFYELCDEYGIMVWQDFMFACSMYPGDEPFLNNIREEAIYNVKRLRNYPSIALWCGNNEIDTAWSHYIEHAGWGWKQQYTHEQREKLWADYETIFHRILPEAVASHAHNIAYWPSSPMQALTGDETQHANNSTVHGDIHYWGVWHAVEPFSNYNVHIGRFMSEYGFQSFPEYESVRAYAEESDLALESEVMLAHQKNGAGNRLIKQYMDMYMKQPKDFPSFLYVSQVLQAEAMKMAIEAHRRRKGFCMGTLYWQMNDCWPVASWAGMDYFGRWKAAHYYVKRSFKDVLVSIDGTQENQVNIHLVSDSPERVSGTLRAALYDFDGALLWEMEQETALEAGAAALELALQADELLQGRKVERVVLLATLEQNGEVIDSKEHYFATAQQIELSEPTITVTEVEGSGGTAFVVASDRLAKDVMLSAEKAGVFSDNFFDLIPGQPRNVHFYERIDGEQALAAAKPGQLTVRSMIDYIAQEVNCS